MRRNEARNVRGEHIDLKAHQIDLPDKKAGERAATVFITPELDTFLRECWPDGNTSDGKLIADEDLPADENDVSRIFRRIAKRATVKGSGKDGFCTLHDLRRSFGSRWAAKVPAQVLQRMMRHSSFKTTLDFYADVEQAPIGLLWPTPPATNSVKTKKGGNVEVNVEVVENGDETDESESTQPKSSQANEGGGIRTHDHRIKSAVPNSVNAVRLNHLENPATSLALQLAPEIPESAHEPDSDLARIVAVWPELPEAIRAGIRAMVEAAREKRD